MTIVRQADRLVIALVAALFAVVTPLAGQQPPPAAAASQEASPATPATSRGTNTPDGKAYAAANSLTEPAAKRDAFERFIEEFPKSTRVGMARQALLDLFIANWPDQHSRILGHASALVGALEPEARMGASANVAEKLLGGSLLLDEARRMAREALAAATEDRYLAMRRKPFADRKAKPPADNVLLRGYRSDRARLLAALGRIELELGHQSAGHEALVEALSFNPANGAAAAALAARHLAEGRHQQAFEVLATPALDGTLPPDGHARLREAFGALHGDSGDGLEEALDARYRERYPNPIVPPGRGDRPKTVGRVVLAELFTGSGCPPCVAADLTFDAILERYPRTEVALLVHHLHIPRPDPMVNPSSQARATLYGVNAVPTYRIDGDTGGVGGGTRDQARASYDKITAMLDKALAEPPGARLVLAARLDGRQAEVFVTVADPAEPPDQLRLHVALVEQIVRYSGENGIRFHTMVVRSLAGERADGLPLEEARDGRVSWRFDLDRIVADARAHLDDFEVNNTRFGKFSFVQKKHDVDADRLAVVAFVQHEQTRKVLQAAYTPLGR